MHRIASRHPRRAARGFFCIINAGQAALYSPSQNAWLPVASATSSTVTGASVLLQTGQVLRLNGSSSVAELFTP
jgi:hypothetical protein